MKPIKQKYIFCIEGCHGVGKSTVVQYLGSEYHIIPEAFLELKCDGHHLPLISPILQLQWLSNWFIRVARALEEHDVVVTDRSPYTSICYMKNGYEMEDIISRCLDSLVKDFVHMKTIHIVGNEKQILLNIQKRMKKEPNRMDVNELNVPHLKKIMKWYDKQVFWDVTLFNNGTIDDLLVNVNNVLDFYLN